jgi:pimeloyl-ACP methyl ester carboxylesterase
MSRIEPAAAVRYVVAQYRRFARPRPGADYDQPEDHGLCAEPFSVRTEDRLRISGWVFTPPRPWGVVIVCHARGASKSRTLQHAALLHGRGLVTVCFDFRGCGRSDDSRRPGWGGLWAPLRDLSAVARFVESRYAGDPLLRDRVVLLGCSFGGNMALAHAGHTTHRYRALILDSTPLVRWGGMLETLLARERQGSGWPRLRAAADRLLIRGLVTTTRADALYRHAQTSARTLRHVPVLHIVGERDTMFDIDESCRFLETNYAGEAAVWRVRRGRHLTNHVISPDEYADRVTELLITAFDEPKDQHVRARSG